MYQRRMAPLEPSSSVLTPAIRGDPEGAACGAPRYPLDRRVSATWTQRSRATSRVRARGAGGGILSRTLARLGTLLVSVPHGRSVGYWTSGLITTYTRRTRHVWATEP